MSGDAPPAATGESPAVEILHSPRAIASWRVHLYSKLVVLAGMGVALTVWGFNLAHYFPFFADDGFISLRYSQRLLAGEGLTWTDGERVEGYSNLAYVLACAGLGLFIDLITAARVVGICGGLVLGLAIYRAGRHIDRAAWLAMPMVWLTLAVVSSLAIWAIGGLEASLLVGLLGWGYVEWILHSPQALQRPFVAMAWTLPLAFACWTRPDAPLFVAYLAVWELLRGRLHRQAWARAALAALVPAIFYLGQLAFRWAYYHDVVPNTARIKAEPGFERLDNGWRYVMAAMDGAWFLVGLAALGLYAAIIGKHRRGEIALVVGAAVMWLAYVVSIGGDIFPGWRHALPAYGLMALGGLWGLEWLLLAESGGGSRRWQGALVVLGFATTAALHQAQRRDPGNLRAEHERWEWAAQPVGQLYRRFAASKPLLAVEPAGAVPYFSELPALDMFGLCDRHIARQSARPGRGLAHDHGDGLYVWQRKPDLMVLWLPWGGGPISASGQEMIAQPGYREAYRDLYFRAVDPFDVRATAQVRVDGRLGIVKQDDRVEIPGYFFQGAQAIGHAVAGQKVGALVEGRQGSSGVRVELGAGTWQVTVPGASSWLGLHLRNRSPQPLQWNARSGLLQVNAPGTIELRVSSDDEVQSEFAAVHLLKVSAPPIANESIASDAEVQVRRPSSPSLKGKGTWQAIALSGPKGFVAIDEDELLPAAAQRHECDKSLPGIDSSFRLDTYALNKRDEWTGEAVGPSFTIPEQGVAYVCSSGADHSAGVRLRLVATQEVIRLWLGHNSANPKAQATDLSAYAGQVAQFEAYDRRKDAWGHVRIYGLSVMVPTKVAAAAK